MKNPSLFNESNSATYCPEDDKLRLYVGRVPHDEYEALKKEGWTSTPKQDCDFSAVWTPSRYQTCLSYAGMVADEDMDPAERAADRAERFSGYLERRTDEALTFADSYDDQDQHHGYQSEAKAARAAARHDRIGSKAVDVWSKAEYWQRRTAGVISHALHKSSPAVRMGRIKTLESELRKREKDQEEWIKTWGRNMKIIQDPEPLITHIMARFEKDRAEAEKSVIEEVLGSCYQLPHPRNGDPKKRYIFELLADPDPVTMADFFAYWQAKYPVQPTMETNWINHLKLRLAYENQMLEAQGGRAASVEMETGGRFMGKLIWRVNKSPATGRVTSVSVIGPKVERWSYKTKNILGTDYAEYQFETERAAPGSYEPPTEGSQAELEAIKKKAKANKPKTEACPLINPTDEDAQRLQDIWNERAMDERQAAYKRMGYSFEVKDCPPSKVLRMTQEQYSAYSVGTYAKAKTIALCKSGEPELTKYFSPEKTAIAKVMGKPICKIRTTYGKDYGAKVVIVLSDKPQKPLPAAIWETLTA